MAFDKVEIKVIMQVSTVVKSKMPVAWGWLSAYFSVRVYTCTFDSFLSLIPQHILLEINLKY